VRPGAHVLADVFISFCVNPWSPSHSHLHPFHATASLGSRVCLLAAGQMPQRHRTALCGPDEAASRCMEVPVKCAVPAPPHCGGRVRKVQDRVHISSTLSSMGMCFRRIEHGLLMEHRSTGTCTVHELGKETCRPQAVLGRRDLT